MSSTGQLRQHVCWNPTFVDSDATAGVGAAAAAAKGPGGLLDRGPAGLDVVVADVRGCCHCCYSGHLSSGCGSSLSKLLRRIILGIRRRSRDVILDAFFELYDCGAIKSIFLCWPNNLPSNKQNLSGVVSKLYKG